MDTQIDLFSEKNEPKIAKLVPNKEVEHSNNLYGKIININDKQAKKDVDYKAINDFLALSNHLEEA